VSGVNDLGVIAGYYTDVSGGQHGFIDTSGSVVTLDGPAGSTGYVVTSINSAGTITGAYWSGSTEHAFVKTATGQPTVLDDYPKVAGASQQGTFASQINNNGVIVGYYFTKRAGPFTYVDASGAVEGSGPSTAFHGFVWKNGQFTTYDASVAPTPQKPAAPAYGTQLLGLNNVGGMVGTLFRNSWIDSQTTLLGGKPVQPGFEISGVTFKKNAAVTRSVTFTTFWDSSTSTYNGCGYTDATAINDSGMIVGNSGNGCGGGYAVWESTGGAPYNVYFVDTQLVGGTVLVVNSVNNNTPAQIGGTWYNSDVPGGTVNGPNHGFTGVLGSRTGSVRT
jgi:hypothetical protein